MSNSNSISDALITGKGHIFPEFHEVAQPHVSKEVWDTPGADAEEMMEMYSLHAQFVHATRDQLYQLLSELSPQKLSDIQTILDDLRD